MPPSNLAGNPDGIDWDGIRARILANLDVAGIYQGWGLRIKRGAVPNADGWLICHAIDREDKKPSCSININSGYYKTYSGDNGIRFWDMAQKYGRFSSYTDALKHYAELARVELPGGTGRGNRKASIAASSTWTAPPRKQEKPQPSLHDLIEPLQQRAESNGDANNLAKAYGWRPDAVKRAKFGSPDPKDRKFYPAKKGEKYVPRIYSPECQVDEDGRPTVTNFFGRSPTRNRAVEKWGLKGRKRGLFIPDGILRDANRTGILFVTEGASDAATLLCLRLAAVAYWAAGSGGHLLARLIKRAIGTGKLRPDVRIVLTIDNDNYGRGWNGTATVATILADDLQRSIYRIWMPSDPDHIEGDTKVTPPERRDERYEIEDYFGCGTGFAERPTPRYDPSKSSAYKDVHAWFEAAHGSAHLWTDEEAVAVGNQFLESHVMRPDSKPRAVPGRAGWVDWLQDDDIRVFHPTPKQLGPKLTEVIVPECVAETVPERHPEESDSYPLKSREEVPNGVPLKDSCPERCPEGSDSYPLEHREAIPEEAPLKDSCPTEPAEAVPVVWLRAVGLWDETPIAAIAATCRVRCPHGTHKVGVRRSGGTAGIGFRTSCVSWRCVGCGPRLRLDWVTHARKIFRGDVTPFEALFVWRGEQARFDKRGRKKINDECGNFIRVSTCDGNCLVIATVPFWDAAPIAPIDADREFIAAVAAYTPPEGGRHQPISKSREWGIVRCGSGQFVIAGTFRGADVDVNASYAVLHEMGCIPGGMDENGFRRCEWPANWDLAARLEATQWASIRVSPLGTSSAMTTSRCGVTSHTSCVNCQLRLGSPWICPAAAI